jgi:hypothetical protein
VRRELCDSPSLDGSRPQASDAWSRSFACSETRSRTAEPLPVSTVFWSRHGLLRSLSARSPEPSRSCHYRLLFSSDRRSASSRSGPSAWRGGRPTKDPTATAIA